MMDSRQVRRATAHDQALLAQRDSHVRPDVLTQLINAGRILVLEEEGALLGWLRWSLFWDEIPFMNMLFVSEGHRGRGLGSALLDTWEIAAQADGYNTVMTSSQADEDAQHLYRKRGYVDCGALLLSDQAIEIVFRKALTANSAE